VHLIVAMLLSAGIMMFAEEITDVKYAIYDLLKGEKEEPVQDLSVFDDYPQVELDADAWYNQSRLIYHAGGGIDGLDYTNSVEALEATLEQGRRLVEVDFGYTSDGALVCVHYWSNVSDEDVQLSLAEFEAANVYGKYTTMTAETLIGYMAQYEDMYLVIDTKETDSVSVVRDLLAMCGENTAIADRFVIQLYDKGIKEQMMQLHPFGNDNFLFTAYKFGPGKFADIMQLCYDEQIQVVTVAGGKWDANTIGYFRDKGFLVFNHTLNRLDYANIAAEQGVYGFYTDFLSEEDFPLDAVR